MKNTERQKSLDKQKWLMSEEVGTDLSGEMLYCEFCFYKDLDGFCPISQQERENKCLCAKAWNRYKRHS
jgi:hypothetical protein